ncbi:MAG: hypothetical protein HW411_1166, partial [Gammaproteobacteria bacterium]|nr:hypothetical protein [Gammaproteobacteria bacterium]
SVAVPDATLTPPSLESYLLHLTSMDGGNAKGLYGTILAMQSWTAIAYPTTKDGGSADFAGAKICRAHHCSYTHFNISSCINVPA